VTVEVSGKRAETAKQTGNAAQGEGAKKSQKRKAEGGEKGQSVSGESEQEEKDRLNQSGKPRKKKFRISSKATIDEADEAGQVNIGKCGNESKHAPPGTDKGKWDKARPPHRCQQCVAGRRVCEIYTGRPLGCVKIACVQCNSMRKGCSFKQGEIFPFVRKRRRQKKVESDGEDFGSEYYEDKDKDDNGDDNDDDNGDDNDNDADVDGKPKKGKGIQKGKGKKRVSPTRSGHA
jgi:hypothetical protein